MPSPTFRSLGIQQFRWLFASNTAFFFAMNGQFVARSYLAFKLTESALALGLVNLAVAVPMLIISPFGGAISDRVEKRRLIMAGQATLLANEAVVFVLLFLGMLEFWHLMLVVFVIGAVFPFILPARQSIAVEIVGRSNLANAMALQMGSMNAMRIVAPAAIGFLIFLIGLTPTYLVAVVVYGVALFAMLHVRPSFPAARAEPTTIMADIREGVRYLWSDRPVRTLLVLGLVPMLLAMPFQALLVVFAEDVWEVGARGLGILQAAAGLGGLVGALVVARYGDVRQKMLVMLVSLLGFAASLLFFSMSPYFLLALGLVLVADVFASVFQTLNNTVIQVLIPDEMRGRVLSLMMMSFGLTPLGTLLVSIIAEWAGAPIAVGTASLLTALIGILIFALSSSLRRVNELAAEGELRPLARERAPLPADV